MATEQRDYSKYILPGALALLAFALYEKFFGSGSSGAQITATDTAGVTSSLSTQAAKGETATISAAQAAQAANSIYNIALSESSIPFSATGSNNIKWLILNNVNNLTDLLLIMQQFGTRNANTTGFSLCGLSMLTVDCTKLDLTGLVRMGLTTWDLQDVNIFLSGANINYQF